MAKAPSAKVSKSSGQGVSRLSYQKGRSLGNRGAATPAGVDASFSTSKQDYAKPSKVKYPSGINVSYGNTYHPSSLEDVQALGKGAPPKGLKLTPAKAKKLK